MCFLINQYNFTVKIKERINALLHHLNQGLHEREQVLQLAVLTMFAGESLFLLGPPGVAKSMIARRMSQVFASGRSFEYLMNRFSTPDELFGPIAISKLKNDDKYERVVAHYLPWADVGFLDEIWKAGPSIQNALLTIINEKRYRNGQQEIEVPLKLLVAASNELPAQGQGLEALWDRFIVRVLVVNMTQPKNFVQFLRQTATTKTDFEVPKALQITEKEYQTWRKAIRKVIISDEVVNVIQVIRQYIAKHNEKAKTAEDRLYISDRRWRKIVGLLQASAYLNGRQAIDLMDCFLIAPTLWNTPEQIPLVKGFLEDAIEKHGYGLSVDLPYFKQEIDDLALDVKNHTKEEVIRESYVPKPITHNGQQYYELEMPFSYRRVRYELILKDDLDQLAVNDNGNLSLWSENLRHYESFEIARLTPNKIHVEKYDYNYVEYDKEHMLIQQRQTTKEYTTKRPHKAILKTWNAQVKQLHRELDQAYQKLETYRDQELAGLRQNLFVQPKLASIVERNLDQTRKGLMSAKNRLTTLKKSYHDL